jgi:PleD family two-component response regulator
VQQANIAHEKSPLGSRITVSLGVATAYGSPATGDGADLVRQADAQLYLAKSRGRNQVSAAEAHAA